jgi:oligopeptide transport system ATP-binding protein
VVLEAQSLKKHFPVTKGLLISRVTGWIKAVDGVSFELREGETLGVVGESGCGKSTTAKMLLMLERPTEGSILFQGQDIYKADASRRKEYRSSVQAVFQDPWSSLNPRIRVKDIIAEPMVINWSLSQKELRGRVHKLLLDVGLHPYHAELFPHEFSGGQRQRIGIARALAVNPSFIVCDEPVSALDVSIQAQVINLLEDLQSQFGLTYLFIAHDLSVVRHISDRVAVMYLGHIVEIADRNELYDNPLHPYTRALLSAVPIPDPIVEAQRERIILAGDVPSPMSPPAGCVFHTRCPVAVDDCQLEMPNLREVSPGHWVACIQVEGWETARAYV